jgi:hypothetical protein
MDLVFDISNALQRSPGKLDGRDLSVFKEFMRLMNSQLT